MRTFIQCGLSRPLSLTALKAVALGATLSFFVSACARGPQLRSISKAQCAVLAAVDSSISDRENLEANLEQLSKLSIFFDTGVTWVTVARIDETSTPVYSGSMPASPKMFLKAVSAGLKVVSEHRNTRLDVAVAAVADQIVGVKCPCVVFISTDGSLEGTDELALRKAVTRLAGDEKVAGIYVIGVEECNFKKVSLDFAPAIGKLKVLIRGQKVDPLEVKDLIPTEVKR